MASYLTAGELNKYFDYVKPDHPVEYICSMLILYGGFTLSDCVKLSPSRLSGSCVLNEHIGRVLVFSDTFKAYLSDYLADVPSDALSFCLFDNPQQNVSVLIRRAFKSVGIDAGPKQLLNTFYFRYLVNCGSFDNLPIPNHYKAGWMESRVGISTAEYKSYKDEFITTRLPSDFINLAEAFFRYAVNDPMLSDKCHKIYSLMSDCVSIMSDSHPL